MKDKTQATVMTITPAMAKSWLQRYRSRLQRKVTTSQVKYLAETMQRGTFKQDTAIELCRSGDDVILTDGQHRLAAVELTGMAQRFVVVVRNLEDNSALAEDYTRTDKGLRRQLTEDYKTLDLPGEFDLPASVVKCLGTSIEFIRGRFAGKNVKGFHPEDRLEMMREYSQGARLYYACIGGSNRNIRNKLLRSSTMAVGIVTFRYSAEVFGTAKIEEFWQGVALDDGLFRPDARKAAHEHLLITTIVGGNMADKRGQAVSPAYSSRYLANCFNAWIEERGILYSKVPNSYKPMVILGSPFDGKQ